jgi:large subunit ribosomal protein L17
MRHRKKVGKLGRVAPHRNALLRNLVTDLLRHERLTTTLTKAKALRPVAERMVTLGKRDTLHARRRAARLIRDDDVVRKVFNELAPRYAERPGGYTRIMRLEPRAGDRAEMAIIEMVEAGSGAKE